MIVLRELSRRAASANHDAIAASYDAGVREHLRREQASQIEVVVARRGAPRARARSRPDRRRPTPTRSSSPPSAACSARRCRSARSTSSGVTPFSRRRLAERDRGSRRRDRSASMSCSASAAMCSGRSRRASRPPCTAGCSVFTRPSQHLGKPRDVADVATGRPASRNAFARAAGGDELPAERGQAAGEVDQAGFIGNGKKCARHW